MRKRWRWRRGEGRYNIVGCFESRPLKHHNISSSVDSVRKEQKKTAIICSRKKSKKSVRIKYSQLENQLEAEQKNWSWSHDVSATFESSSVQSVCDVVHLCPSPLTVTLTPMTSYQCEPKTDKVHL